jgi:hypothetical protein
MFKAEDIREMFSREPVSAQIISVMMCATNASRNKGEQAVE